MNHNKEILEKLTQRTIQYLKTNLKMNEIDSSYSIEEVSSFQFKNLTTLIDISGKINSTVGMSVSRDVAYQVVKGSIYGEVEKSVLLELAEENLAETLNITLGNIIQDVSVVKEGGDFEISTPYKPVSQYLKITDKNDTFISEIKYKNQTILLSIYSK
jgi:CheY-specific phosphatase CheX